MRAKLKFQRFDVNIASYITFFFFVFTMSNILILQIKHDVDWHSSFPCVFINYRKIICFFD